MQTLRRAHRLASLVLAVFALALGVAIASPLAHLQTMELVCSTAGVIKLVQTGDEGRQPAGHLLECPLCLVGNSAPPPVLQSGTASLLVLTYAPKPWVSAHMASRSAAALPARGPPVKA